jgi:serine/threonine-protein kinase
MKLCQQCSLITDNELSYCRDDGQLLVEDPLATALQESLGSKYTLTRLIGTGSMGAVYRALHHALDEVAIKVMLGPPENHKLSERFLREARALRKLHTPHAVLVYDLERSATGLTYMVMEMLEGQSLREELRVRKRLSLKDALEVTEAVCDALSAAHSKGIIHRDLKPDNILMAEEKNAGGTSSRTIKIVDFGIAKLRGTEQGGVEASMQLTKYGTPIGTPFYMSPEQWFGEGPGFTALDGRTDIYALGCTLYEMLAGHPPFLGQTTPEMRRKHLNDAPVPLHEITRRVPEAISRVILRALEKDRDDRQATAEEFAAEFRRAYEESVIGTTSTDDQKRSSALQVSEDSAQQNTPEHAFQMRTTEELPTMSGHQASAEAQPAIEEASTSKESFEEAAPIEQADVNSDFELTMVQGFDDDEDFEETLEPGKYKIEIKPKAQADSPVVSDTGDQQLATTINPALKITAEQMTVTAQDEERKTFELLLARVGTLLIGLPAAEADGVTAMREPVPLPHAPLAVLGVVNVRGRMLTLIDPLVLLGEQRVNGASALPRFILALRGDEQLALAADYVEGSIKISPESIDPIQQSPGGSADAVRGVVSGAQGQIIVLDVQELFTAAMQGEERRRQRT